jgi:integrase
VRSISVKELTWQCIDWDEREIDFQKAGVTDATTINPMSKAKRKPRPIVKMGDTLLAILLEAHANRDLECNHVICWKGKPIGRAMVNKMTAVTKRLGLEGVSAHTFRHSVVTILSSNKEDIGDIQRQVGHLSRDTTDLIYNHAVGSQDTANKLDRIMARLAAKA